MALVVKADLRACELDEDEWTWLYISAHPELGAVNAAMFLSLREMLRNKPDLLGDLVLKRFA